MNLTQAILEKEYIIKSVETNDEEMDAFLFSLGCYSGRANLISKKEGATPLFNFLGISLAFSINYTSAYNYFALYSVFLIKALTNAKLSHIIKTCLK